MNKLFKLLKISILTLAIAGLSYSCDDKDETGTDKTYTVEESKDKLDDGLTDVAEKLDAITTLRSTNLAESMMEMDMEDVSMPDMEELIQTVAEGEGTSFSEMEDAIEAGLINITLSNQIDWGTFSYNATDKNFLFTKGAVGTMVLEMPAEDAATTNDVEVKIVFTFQDDVDYETMEDMEIDEDIVDITLEEIFTDVVFSIKQSGDLLFQYDFHITLDSEGMVNKIATSITLEDFKVSTEIDATTREEFSHSSSFELDGEELIGYDVAFIGDLTDERMEELIEEIEAIDESNEAPSDEFLSTLNYDLQAELRFSNFVISGLIDGSKIYDAYDAYEDKDNFDDETEEDMQYIADEMNKAMTLGLKDQNGTVIGKAEAFIVQSEYDDWEFNQSTERYEETIVTYYELQLRFKFADGTYMSPEDEDMEGELEAIFADFIDAIEALSDKIEEETDGFMGFEDDEYYEPIYQD